MPSTPPPRVARLVLRSIAVVAGLAAATLAALVGFGGCEIASSFSGAGYSRSKGVTLPGAGNTVIIGVTNATLDGSKRALFDQHTRNVVRSLPSHDGFIGSSVRTRLMGNEVWTMTVWRDEAALDSFVRSPVHVEAIRKGLPAVIEAKFARFSWPAESVPPKWGEIIERLKTVEPIAYGAGARRSEQSNPGESIPSYDDEVAQ